MATTYIPLPDETAESESGKVWILGGLLGNSALSAKYPSFLVPLQSPIASVFPTHARGSTRPGTGHVHRVASFGSDYTKD